MKRLLLFTIILFATLNLTIHNVYARDTTSIGDDPGVSIQGPTAIGPNQRVELDINFFTSAGNIYEDGTINIKIPKNIVKDQTGQDIIDSTSINSPFSYESTPLTDDGQGNWVLNLVYNHLNIPISEAFSAKIHINFQSKSWLSSDVSAPDNVAFQVVMSNSRKIISRDDCDADVIKTSIGRPHFAKQSTLGREVIDGIKNVSVLNLTDPKSNIFAILVNYDEQSLKDVVVTDTYPDNILLSDPNPYVPATGDATIYHHFRIARVTSWNASGGPATFEYVTKEFANKISTTPKGFSVNLGNIESGYVLMYGQKFDASIPSDSFGVRYNSAKLTDSSGNEEVARLPISLQQKQFDKASLKNTVDKHTMATNQGKLQYNLLLKSGAGTLPKDTIVTDQLPEDFNEVDNFNFDSKLVSSPKYDSVKNTVSYHLLREMHSGENTNVSFEAQLNNNYSQLVPGHNILNRASYNYYGAEIYSNSVTTLLESSLKLKKVDKLTGSPLPGAVFEFKNSNGEFVSKNTTNSTGEIILGILAPGEYTATEVKAPDFYKLEKTPIKFTVINGMINTIELSKSNSLFSGGVVLTKIDAKTKIELKGAEFELQDSVGRSLKKHMFTNERGKIVIDNLIPGKYQFIETCAPKNYVLDKEPVKFSIDKEPVKKVQVVVENRKIISETIISKGEMKRTIKGERSLRKSSAKKLPRAGDNDGLRSFFMGLYILLFGLFIKLLSIIFRRKD